MFRNTQESTFFILEMSQNFHASTVAMLCVVISMITFRLLSTSSFFEMQLLGRGFDLSIGMKNFQLSRVSIGEIPRSECCIVKQNENQDKMIKTMQKLAVSEGYIVDDESHLIKKINIVNIFHPSYFPEEDALVFYEDQSLLEAVELASDFVGESIPIINREGRFVGAVTEGDLFQAVQTYSMDD